MDECILILFQWLHVQVQEYVCLMEKDKLRSVSMHMEYGEQYVMMDGMIMMPE